MSVTREFNYALPFLSGGKVVKWELGMTFTNGTSGNANFYQQSFSENFPSSAITGLSSEFTPKAENSWTRAQLLTLVSSVTGDWDNVFTSAVNSVITNPTEKPQSDNTYVIPS